MVTNITTNVTSATFLLVGNLYHIFFITTQNSQSSILMAFVNYLNKLHATTVWIDTMVTSKGNPLPLNDYGLQLFL